MPLFILLYFIALALRLKIDIVRWEGAQDEGISGLLKT